MTLDEAIKHAEEVTEDKENEGKLLCQSEGASIGCLTCAEEHRQLAEWLKDYKQLLEPKTGHWIKISPAEIYECSECGQNVMTSDICAYKFCHGCGIKMVEPQERQVQDADSD